MIVGSLVRFRNENWVLTAHRHPGATVWIADALHHREAQLGRVLINRDW